MLDLSLDQQVSDAVNVLRGGGVIAYPTEYCFGLGCDPQNTLALERLLAIKKRKADQGVILIAADLAQVQLYAAIDTLPVLIRDQITASWPGPNTWVLPALPTVPDLVKGKHPTIAMRVPDHDVCLALLNQFGHPIVSTSANRTGQKEHLSAATVRRDMGVECDYVVDLPVGGATHASNIRDAVTGTQLR